MAAIWFRRILGIVSAPSATGIRQHVVNHLPRVAKTSFLIPQVLPKFCYFSTSAVCQSSPLLSICKQMTPQFSLFQQPQQLIISNRSATKFSLVKGKSKSVNAVKRRFFRLNSGIWIRPRAGRSKRLHQKSGKRRYRLRQHVFCNARQCRMLDKMVTTCWKRPRYYVDDIYNPYHERYDLSYQHWR